MQQNPEGSPRQLARKICSRDQLQAFGAGRASRLLFLASLLVLLLPEICALSTSPASTPTTGLASAHKSTLQATDSATTGSQPASSKVNFRNTDLNIGYVGSKACERCHETEYRKFLQTPHGQSATLPDARPELKQLPSEGVTVCQSDPDQSDGKRCYRVFRTKDGYSMSQFDQSADGSETHTEVEKIAFGLGTPLIATGYVIQRGDYLFEAPLTYYNVPVQGHPQGWGLSPGYGNDSVGFTRPVVGSCLTCHVGQLRPTDAASNRYLQPPFEELSIGCENCHGPGALHVKERQAGLPKQGLDTSIVNPKHLTSQLADDACTYCHELGQARVPLPGRKFEDYRPAVPLIRTQAIFKSQLLLGWNAEEWSDEMATSACYRFSRGALRCSTCHDPHFTPSSDQAPEFYRSKCLTCHQSSSCTLPLSERQHTQPIADNCITCHMPKHVAPKLIKIGARGTSHRITKNDDEPVPPMDTPRTTPDPKTGLILVNSDSANTQSRLPRVVLLSAYQGVLARDRSREDLADHYKTLLEEMTGDQNNANVLSAFAGAELAKNTPQGNRQAIKDLNKAVDLDSIFPKDYLLLSELQDRSGDPAAAIKVLSIAIEKFPYNPAPYEKLVSCYQRTGDMAKASEVLHRGLKLFPADKNLLQLAATTAQP